MGKGEEGQPQTEQVLAALAILKQSSKMFVECLFQTQLLMMFVLNLEGLCVSVGAKFVCRQGLVLFQHVFIDFFARLVLIPIFHHGDEVRSKNLKRKHVVDHSKETENTVQVFVRGKRVEEKLGVLN